MMMADRTINRQEESTLEHTDQQSESILDVSPSETHNRLASNSSKEAYKLDLNNSSVRSDVSTRDSGYITDLSPATIASPPTNILPRPDFFFHDLDLCATQECGLSDSLLMPDHTLLHSSTSSSSSQSRGTFDRTSRPSGPPRISPALKASEFPRGTSSHGTQVSCRSVSESPEANAFQFDFESDNEGEGDEVRSENRNKSTVFTSPSNSRCNYNLLGNLRTSYLHITRDVHNEGDDSTLYKRDETFKNWDIASEPQTPICRRRSQSLPQHLHCSENIYYDDEDDDSFVGACGGGDPSMTDELCDQRGHTHLESYHRHGRDICSHELEATIDIDVEGNSRADSISRRDSDSALTLSQGFQPGHFDCDSRDNDSDNVFTLSPQGVDGGVVWEESQGGQGSSRGMVIVRDRTTQRSVPQRRVGVTTNLLTPSELFPPWSSTFSGVSVSTQTPHATSVMIQQILGTPIPLPNEARGTAASRLHRLSESGVPLRPGPTPLPDIITSVGRDRSLSVPNLQSLASRQRAREVGRELRRLSDEFNVRRFLSPVNEEFDGHPASYPRMHPTYFRDTITQFTSLLRDTFRGRHNS